MNKTIFILFLCIIVSPLITIKCVPKAPLKKKIKTFFSPYKVEKISQQELPALSIESIAISNIHGPITIKTGWKKDSIFLKTIKRAKKIENLNNIKITRSIKNNHIDIKTEQFNDKLAGLVEYELIVPASLHITINASGNGDVIINDIHGPINVVSNDTITITNSKKSVTARTLKKGNISIINATGPINAQSNYGNITGENIGHSFNAHSTNGKISVAFKKLPSTSAIDLKTNNNINLALPIDTNAEIRGTTTNGTLVSNCFITLRSYTTQLNNNAWNKFKKEVDGTLGTGEATIKLHSTNGNIKITENKIT